MEEETGKEKGEGLIARSRINSITYTFSCTGVVVHSIARSADKILQNLQ